MVVKSRTPWHQDLSTWALIFSNLVALVVAVLDQWSLIDLLWVYWSQSVVIGIFAVVKMMDAQGFTLQEGKKASQVIFSTMIKSGFALFFCIHYGMFHFVYFIFLLVFSSEAGVQSPLWILIGASLFFANHLFSFYTNRKHDRATLKDVGRIFARPYARILPMHLTIIFFGFTLGGGATKQGVLLMFGLLKTGADVLMHRNEHFGISPKLKSLKIAR